jgi:hypothetical protein
VRLSHENKHVQQAYDSYLGKPLSKRAERLLHTSYAPRRSKRDVLARFLDAVDRRDADAAAALVDDNVEWRTNTAEFGVVTGRGAVKSLINERLPPQKLSTHRRRHRFADATRGFVVDAPLDDGKRSVFDVQLHHNTNRITKLTRVDE